MTFVMSTSSGGAQENGARLPRSTDLVITGANVVAVVNTRRLDCGVPTQVYRGANKFYYEPALLPSWHEYRSNVEKSCTADTDASDLVKILLTIFLSDFHYKDDIIYELKNQEDLQASPPK